MKGIKNVKRSSGILEGRALKNLQQSAKSIKAVKISVKPFESNSYYTPNLSKILSLDVEALNST